MATTLNLGKVMVTLGGEHNTSTAYDRLTLVTSGGSSYISKKDVPAGVALTDTTYWQLHGAKGADGTNGEDGTDGEDAYQPFKGWFDSSSALSAAYPNPQVGDFAYVKGATSTDPVAVYYCATAGTWADSGSEFNPANNQSFQTGQDLDQTKIINDPATGGANHVLSAEAGKTINAKVAALGLKIDGSVKNYKNGQNYNYTLSPRGSIGQFSRHCREEEYIPVTAGDVIVWHSAASSSDSSTAALGLAGYDTDKSLIACWASNSVAERTITIGDSSSVKYVRASFLLSEIANCFVKVNGVVVWSPKEDYTGHEQRLLALESITPLTSDDIVDDPTTGGSDKAASAEQVKILNNKIENATSGDILPSRIYREETYNTTAIPMLVMEGASISTYSTRTNKPSIANDFTTTIKKYDVRRVSSLSFPIDDESSSYFGWVIVFATYEENGNGIFIRGFNHTNASGAQAVCTVSDGICTVDVDAARAGGISAVFDNVANIGVLYISMVSASDEATVDVKLATKPSDFKWLDLSEYQSSTPTLILPIKLIAAVGREYNVYKDNVLLDCTTDNICLLQTNIVSSLSSTNYETKKRVRWTPTGVLDRNVDMELYTKLLSHLDATHRINVIAVDDSVLSGKTIRYMMIGDSKVNGGWSNYALKAALVAAGATVTSLGTRTNPNSGTAPMEGRNGWSAKDYVSVASKSDVVNAFWNPSTSKFDFSYYMAQQGYNGVDVVIICLGTNDVANGYASQFCSNIEQMIDSIHEYNSSAVVIVGVTEPFSSSVVGSQSKISYNIKRLDIDIIEAFDQREDEHIFIAPLYLSLDPDNDYRTTEVDLSYGDVYRNTGKKDVIVMGSSGTDQVHQSTVGYTKNAEVMYATMVYALSLT